MHRKALFDEIVNVRLTKDTIKEENIFIIMPNRIKRRYHTIINEKILIY